MSEDVRIGLVGLGRIAGTHIEVVAERPGLSVEFTVDPGADKHAAFPGAAPPNYADLSDALEVHRPDLVVVATPTHTHVDVAVRALGLSTARVLVEKPLVHDLAALARLRTSVKELGVAERLFTAHHFPFSPEVRWAVDLIGGHPEWGPVTGATAAFYDPYILRGEQAFTSYGSSWLDSGINQLSMLSAFVEFTGLTGAQDLDAGAGAWRTFEFRCGDSVGAARLHTSWRTGASSKKSALTLGRSGVEIWLDHTAMNGFATRDDSLLATFGNDGRTPRLVAHYRPLYESLLSGAPDPVLGFAEAARLTELHLAAATESTAAQWVARRSDAG